MKRLLLLSFLYLMPAAQAVDYVKCEAIQKAAERVRRSEDAQVKAAGKAARNAVLLENCGVTSDQIWTIVMTTDSDQRSEEEKAALACEKPQLPEIRRVVPAAKAAARERIAQRLAKIEADYQAEGCY